MHPHTPATLKEIFRPWYIRVAAAIAALPAAVGLYASVQDQFPAKLPRLQEVVTVSHFFVLPWWAWLFVLQAIFLYALFDYLRRMASAPATATPASGGATFGFAEAMPSRHTPEGKLATLIEDVRGLRSRENDVPAGLKSILEAQKNSFKGELTGVNNWINGLHETTQGLVTRIAEIERRTAIPPNLGDNLTDALTTAQDCNLSQISRIQETVNKAVARLGDAHVETIHLLDFGINATTRNVLRELIRTRPVADKFKPPIDDRERNRLVMGLQQWLQEVRNIANVAAYGAEIARISQQALYEGQHQVRNLDPKERPEDIDALPFADFYAVAYQCEATAGYLAVVVELLDNSDEQKLRFLRQFYETRSKR